MGHQKKAGYGTVYFIKVEGTCTYKLGETSREFEIRLKELSRQSSSLLTPVKTILITDRKTVERRLLEAFKENRLYGELFNFDNHQVIEVCKVMDRLGIPERSVYSSFQRMYFHLKEFNKRMERS